MRRFAILLLVYFTRAQFFDQEKCVIDNRSLGNMWENKLLHDLLNCTRPLAYMPPAQNGTEPLKVNLMFFLKFFTFNSENREFTALAWMLLSWKDDRFIWDPNEYDGLDELLFTTRRFWVPPIRLINSIDHEYNQRYLETPCSFTHNGSVHCVTQVVYKIECVADVQDWPYDAQYCKMEFGTFNETGTKIQLDVERHAVQVITYGTEWIIKDYEQILDGNSEKQLILKFRLERHTEGLSAIVIYPSLILLTLTLTSLLIDARLNQRLLVIFFSLMCHFYFLSDLSWVFPENTKGSPNILMYYRGSLILTSILAVVSFVFGTICRKDVVCPNWVISINDFVYLKVVKFFVWPRWECKDGNNFVKDWTDFANIVNAVVIFVSVVVYVSLYCAFMPQPYLSS